jgi:F0F1-type ATP synthase assembly protein I
VDRLLACCSKDDLKQIMHEGMLSLLLLLFLQGILEIMRSARLTAQPSAAAATLLLML